MTEDRARFVIDEMKPRGGTRRGRRRGNDLSGLTSGAGDERPLAGLRVMVAEDNVILSMHVAQVLESAGAVVVGPYPFASDALAELDRDGGVDAAVLDHELASGTSAAIADRLAALGVPFAFFTSHDRSAMDDAHADAPMIAKPNEAGALLSTMRAMLD